MSVVDVHTHFVPSFVRDVLAAESGEHGLSGTAEHLESPAGRLPLAYPELHSPAAKLAAMGERGVDVSIVSLTPHLFIYEAEHDPVGFARRANDELAAFVAGEVRLHGLATLPIGHPAEAAAELRRGVDELGLRGAIIGTGRSAELPLDRLGLDPLFAAAAELGVPLLVHPFYCGVVTSPEFFLNNSLGVPFDAAWAVGRLIASGALDRHPELRLVLPHGGGALPYLLGRLDNAWRRRPELREHAEKAPSDYLGQLWFDSILHAPAALRFIAELAGAERVLLGTDSPYLTGDADPRASFAAAGLDPALAGLAAAELFGLADVR
ncbi:amidohydrolase family protein [Agromyces soli]|uniref:Amidohydrolase n=1 Tax=Agromyces soli TaxID=659012 RepID=A0ABY4AST1_9MICO|nr:amidohydrolase family protein [Agromyces soli]UOE26218.1 amidohydrolase [Agromyces soli]